MLKNDRKTSSKIPHLVNDFAPKASISTPSPDTDEYSSIGFPCDLFEFPASYIKILIVDPLLPVKFIDEYFHHFESRYPFIDKNTFDKLKYFDFTQTRLVRFEVYLLMSIGCLLYDERYFHTIFLENIIETFMPIIHGSETENEIIDKSITLMLINIYRVVNVKADLPRDYTLAELVLKVNVPERIVWSCLNMDAELCLVHKTDIRKLEVSSSGVNSSVLNSSGVISSGVISSGVNSSGVNSSGVQCSELVEAQNSVIPQYLKYYPVEHSVGTRSAVEHQCLTGPTQCITSSVLASIHGNISTAISNVTTPTNIQQAQFASLLGEFSASVNSKGIPATPSSIAEVEYATPSLFIQTPATVPIKYSSFAPICSTASVVNTPPMRGFETTSISSEFVSTASGMPLYPGEDLIKINLELRYSMIISSLLQCRTTGIIDITLFEQIELWYSQMLASSTCIELTTLARMNYCYLCVEFDQLSPNLAEYSFIFGFINYSYLLLTSGNTLLIHLLPWCLKLKNVISYSMILFHNLILSKHDILVKSEKLKQIRKCMNSMAELLTFLQDIHGMDMGLYLVTFMKIELEKLRLDEVGLDELVVLIGLIS